MTGPTGPLDPALDPDRYDPVRDAAPTGPLDPALDPDRYDPVRDAAPTGPLDPALDPDRYANVLRSGQGETLPGLLGEGAQEDERESGTWLLGLLMVLGFLLLVSLLVRLGH